MASRIDWREVAALVTDEEATDWIEERKRNAAGKSQSTNCTMCASNEPHPMRYKLFSCRSEPCRRAFSGVKCGWKGKVTICCKTKQANIYEAGKHFSQSPDAPNRALKERHKQYCRLMASEGLKPLRIRNGLRTKFSLSSAEMPSLSTVQSFVNNFARTRLAKHDRIHDINAMVRARVTLFHSRMAMHRSHSRGQKIRWGTFLLETALTQAHFLLM
ncbi:unnamed protein product [Phytophthora lilii]|uniref:Unnamed protein product n=1 Tax=Phytophthora lilii TaxID=2077276 RepID=A0A9W6U3W8_9STRA|nr:unnamed protein product [Phytophthora lilii]